MDFSKVPSLYCNAIAMPSILGSINNRVTGSNPSKNSSIEFFKNEGNWRDFLLMKNLTIRVS